ncbi:MAG: YfhO family protein [Candidatus Methylomirabilis oxyfera]|nr:YfhO family protein [Candidatus Methylomirabilis oxyfera]
MAPARDGTDRRPIGTGIPKMGLPEELDSMARTDRSPSDDPKRAAGDSPGRWGTPVLLLFVCVPIAFNSVALLPELRLPIPSLNDGAVHYLFVQRASEALAAGENPFDHWGPELELGFPQFFYYQHLPHLTVVFLHRLLLKQMDLLTLFNLIRYLLLVGFPLTVYWSMRRLGFSRVAGAVAAGSAALLSSNDRYGFEYNSYVWRGFGMYTQLWAMHLFFITLACFNHLMERGTGYVAAVISSTLLAMSHLVYAYMMAVTALALLAVGLNRANARPRIGRLAVAGALAALITSYFWLPFLLLKAYLSASPYLQRWKYDSFGAGDITTWLVNGDLLDYGRLPVLTLLLALGVSAALLDRARPALVALVLLLVWLALYFGRHTWGTLANLLPMHEGLLFHRFVGGVHLAAIFLIGLGGEWLWRRLGPLPERWRAVAAGALLLTLMVPALRERHRFYGLNAQWMERARRALDDDPDARTILSALKDLPPGRTYAGLRANWGKGLQFGDLHFYDLLTFHRIVALSPPYSSWSLNADLIWHFADHNPTHYDLFNVRYVVAPRNFPMPTFLRRLKETPRYTLYRAETSGYARYAAITGSKSIDSQSSLFSRNKAWLLGADPPLGRFVRYAYASGETHSEPPAIQECPGGWRIGGERVLRGRIDLQVECRVASTLVLKTTYHPNWRVTIDGQRAQSFMVSPSFIGVEVPGGAHQVKAEYRSPLYRTVLLILGAFTLLATVSLRRRFARLDTLFSSRA